jgi:hypothetical protein
MIRNETGCPQFPNTAGDLAVSCSARKGKECDFPEYWRS